MWSLQTVTIPTQRCGAVGILALQRGEDVNEKLRQKDQIVSVYEVTGDADIIAVGKFTDTDDMNDQIKSILTDADIRESNTNVVLNAVTENEQFELDVEE